MNINVKWDITYKCNLNCAHCVNGDLLGKIENELNTVQDKRIIEKLKKAGVTYVHILGGEPTARADFLEITRKFEEEGLEFGFNTNGLKLTDSEYLKEIVANKALKNIVCSLEGPNAEINDQIRGKKVFDITTENIRKFVAVKREIERTDLKLTINTVVSKSNIGFIVDMIYFCGELGANEIVLLQFIPEGNGKNLDAVPSIEEQLQLIDTIANCHKEVRGEIEITPKFAFPLTHKYAEIVLKKEFPQTYNMCGAGENYFYINNRGELYPCDRYKKRIESLHEKREINLLNGEFWKIADLKGFEEIYEFCADLKNYKNDVPCSRCDFLGKECFPCPAQKERGTIQICKRMLEEIEDVSN